MSYLQIARFMEAADHAMRLAMGAHLERPARTTRRLYARDERSLRLFDDQLRRGSAAWACLRASRDAVPERTGPAQPVPSFELKVKAPAIACVRFSGAQPGGYLVCDEVRFTPAAGAAGDPAAFKSVPRGRSDGDGSASATGRGLELQDGLGTGRHRPPAEASNWGAMPHRR